MATIVPHEAESLDRLLTDASAQATAPLWTAMRAMVPPSPAPKAIPHVWQWSELRPLLGRAGKLISADIAERRVLMLVNPAMKAPFTSDTLFAGLQMILPGETAPAHRHTAFALRFIIEGNRGFTAVGGEKVMMERGDMILTPSWEFHDHGHEGDGEMIWLDGLDLPVWQLVPANFAEQYSEPRFPSTLGNGASRLKYTWAEMLALLDQGSQSFAAVDYNLRDSAHPVSRTIGASAERIDAGTKSPERRETSSAVYHVVEGAGATRAGSAKLDWRRGDTFVVPAWMPYVHAATEKAYLFRFDDRPLLEALGAYRCAGLAFPEADLRAHAPRPPREMLGGLVLLARTIDKVKAKTQGTLGAYKVTPGMSGYLFEGLEISEDDFTSAVLELRDDEKIAQWVRSKCDPAKFSAINDKLNARGFRDAEHRKTFVPRYPFLEQRLDITNFFDMMLEDDKLLFKKA
ncbi:MAG: cupin domain-containing protein [Candidatus Eremiobacteraeota bacterium]|nr:cupin domain-containing protein [Candidatus Eremiobacteraeota bacterium]